MIYTFFAMIRKEEVAAALNKMILSASGWRGVFAASGGEEDKTDEISALNIKWVEDIARHVSMIKTNVDAMIEARKVANAIECEYEKAVAYHDTILPYFDIIRSHADSLELIVDDNIWPLPKYRELLFIR